MGCRLTTNRRMAFSSPPCGWSTGLSMYRDCVTATFPSTTTRLWQFDYDQHCGTTIVQNMLCEQNELLLNSIESGGIHLPEGQIWAPAPAEQNCLCTSIITSSRLCTEETSWYVSTARRLPATGFALVDVTIVSPTFIVEWARTYQCSPSASWTRAINADRCGSYSIVWQLQGHPFLQIGNPIRRRRLCPPPRNREVVRP